VISCAQRASDATISHCDNINNFKSRLKTLLFTLAYEDNRTISEYPLLSLLAIEMLNIDARQTKSKFSVTPRLRSTFVAYC